VTPSARRASVSLHPFTRSHVKLLARWLEQPHVARWYCDPEGDVAWARNPPAGGSQAIIRWGSAEIGYLRWRRVARPTLDALGLPEIPANSVDADILIGSEAATGQGVGPAALRAFIAETSRDPDVPMIGLTTELSDTRAHRAFERAGFRIVRQYEAPRLGRCHLMILDPRPGQRLRLPEGGPDDSPHFAILSRDGLRLQLGRREDLSVPTSHHAGTLWLDVAGLGDLYSTVEGKVNIEWGPEVYSYHRREFAFKDPDGHLVILSEVTTDPPTCEND
jgi:aminoglycoside 6'-N-acetyltransferase